ncbi:MAG TPA: beta-propeller fold lactonase family protein [Candidatus Angelobacter sp.]|nr:beta-propeller fold lactonase family protein [Candidatus Angelobacter sp.]
MKTAILNLHRRAISPVIIFCLVLFFMAGSAVAQKGHDENRGSARVYVMANRAAENTVVVFQRAEDGALKIIQEVSTGGRGSGPGELPAPFPKVAAGNSLTTQDELVMTEDGRFLLAVNAGSDEISVLAVTSEGLELADKVPSGGKVPLSVAIHGRLVYVMNEGELSQNIFGVAPVIAGFLLDEKGTLHPIPGSISVTGSPDASPGDIIFSPDGEWLIISDKFAETLIHVRHVDEDATTHEVASYVANIPSPFGLAFTGRRILAVVEANASVVSGRRIGVTNGSSMSSYRLNDDGTLEPISVAVRTEQTVACWVRFTPDGRFAYVTNTGSGSVSSYRVSRKGELSLLASVAADAGSPFSEPTDVGITPNGKFLYIISSMGGEKEFILPIPPNAGEVRGFRIGEDGSLTPVTTVSGFPISIAGMVVR